MFGHESLRDHYNEIEGHIKSLIRNLDDDVLVSRDEEELIEYCMATRRYDEIQYDESRNTEVEKERRSREVDSSFKSSTVEDLWIIIRIPVIADRNIGSIIGLRASNFTMNPPSMSYSSGWIITESSPEPERVERVINDIKKEITWRNSDIKQYNDALQKKVLALIKQRKKMINDEEEILDKLTEKVPHVVRKVAEPERVIPVIEVKERVTQLTTLHPKEVKVPYLEKEKFVSIVELIDNCCQFFERTPSTFSKLQEEDLRNVILSSLNAVFEGEARGEAFSKSGKTDISIKVDRNVLFIAECKYYDGKVVIQKGIDQLLSYLTIRDSYGLLVVFSKRKGFSDVLDNIHLGLREHENLISEGEHLSDSHLVGLIKLPEDVRHSIEVHIITYNLYYNESE